MNIPDMINYMDSVINQMENPKLMIEEVKKRDDEALKEAAHRKDEGLDEEESRTDYAQGMYDSGMCEKDFL